MSRPTVIYDGTCDRCARWAATLVRDAGSTDIEVLSSSDPTVASRFPAVPPEAYQQSLQLVLPAGTRLEGAGAVEYLVTAIPKWRWARWLFRLPLARRAATIVYRVIARHRHVL
jgi:predicted DCC family thiol-disulfide oxidoreductase YuxK